MKKEKPTPVVFRVWNRRPYDVLALFPTIPADNMGYLCSSYEHLGQHSPANYKSCIKVSRPATKREAAPLLAELRRIGYRLQIVERATSAMATKRAWKDLVT